MTISDTMSAATMTHPGVRILADRCAGCEECVVRCPTQALTMDTEHWVALADSDLCVGCRQCVRTCPFSAVVVEGPALVAPRIDPEPIHPVRLRNDVSEIRAGFDTWVEALSEAERCLQCPDPTCVRGCPAHNDIPGFINAIRQGDLTGAQTILRRTSVLTDICSRVCNHAAQCEGACSWSLAGDIPVAIGRLERFVGDTQPVPPPVMPPTDANLSVGIIGAGPGGAGAAWELVEAGASVTVYEKDPTPGGLCHWGIPDFTLPEAVSSRPWRQLVDVGVDLRSGVEVSPEDLEELLGRHDAVIVALGASQPMRLSVPGSDLPGVIDATTFLQGAKAALGEGGDPEGWCTALGVESQDVRHGRFGSRVLVLGAGNTAMDVARSARRLGLDATCVDWLDERFALTRPDELDEARQEGVEVRFLRTLVALHAKDDRVGRAELALTTQDRADRRPNVLAKGHEFLDVDLVVMAMGYRRDPAFADALPDTPVRRVVVGVPDRRWTASGILAAPASSYSDGNPVGTLALGREVGLESAALPVTERLWVIGDALIGPATVVEAMAQGRRAALAVLDARPARPGSNAEESADRPRRVLVCYESLGGKTARAAEALADRLAGDGDEVRVLPIRKVGRTELAASDLVVVGSWVEGLLVAGVRPAKAMRAWLAGLPRLGGKRFAVFCTYALAPKGTIPAMRRALEAKGAVVVAQAAFGPRELADTTGAFGPAAFGQELVHRTLEAASSGAPVGYRTVPR